MILVLYNDCKVQNNALTVPSFRNVERQMWDNVELWLTGKTVKQNEVELDSGESGNF